MTTIANQMENQTPTKSYLSALLSEHVRVPTDDSHSPPGIETTLAKDPYFLKKIRITNETRSRDQFPNIDSDRCASEFRCIDDYLECCSPSVPNHTEGWLHVHFQTTEEKRLPALSRGFDIEEVVEDIDRAVDLWDNLLQERCPTSEDLLRIGAECNITSGKWCLQGPWWMADKLWRLVARAVYDGKLGMSAKISKNHGQKRWLICVHTLSVTNEAMIFALQNALYAIGVSPRTEMYYKPDVYTHLGIYTKNKWKITPVLYRAGGLKAKKGYNLSKDRSQNRTPQHRTQGRSKYGSDNIPEGRWR